MARFDDIARAGAVLALLLAFGCGGRPEPAPSPSAPLPASPVAEASPVASSTPRPVLQRSTITSRSGTVPWKLDAERVEYDDQDRTAKVGRLTWSLLDEQGQPTLQVEGRGADVDIENEKVVFDGPVEAIGPKGEVLDVTHLVWDGKLGKFFGSEGVKMTREATVVTGKRMVASPDLKRISVEGDVSVTMRQPR